MKFAKIATLIAATMTFSMARAELAAVPVPSEPVQLSASEINVPAGFGEGTASAVTIEIPLNDSCHHYDRVERVDVTPLYHEFRVYGHVDRKGMCMQVVRLVNHDVILTHLAVGSHLLVFENGDGSVLKKQIQINKAQ